MQKLYIEYQKEYVFSMITSHTWPYIYTTTNRCKEIMQEYGYVIKSNCLYETYIPNTLGFDKLDFINIVFYGNTKTIENLDKFCRDENIIFYYGIRRYIDDN